MSLTEFIVHFFLLKAYGRGMYNSIYIFYTVTLCNFVFLTCSVWMENFFGETGVVHRIT